MNNKTIQHATRTKGFSVIEALVGISILLVIGLVSLSFQTNILSLGKLFSGTLTAEGEARAALKTLSAELRAATPGSDGAYALADTATSTITFYTNTDTDVLKERVRYFLQAKTLKRGVIKPSGSPPTYSSAQEVISTVVRDVANSSTTALFSYYDKNYDGTGSPLATPTTASLVRLVKITLQIDKNEVALPGIITATTQVSIRNLKDNL